MYMQEMCFITKTVSFFVVFVSNSENKISFCLIPPIVNPLFFFETHPGPYLKLMCKPLWLFIIL